MATDIDRLYRQGCASFRALVEDLDAEQHHARVPCTPDWDVHDVVAHVVGIAEDISSGRVDGAGTDPWTSAQVERGRDRPVAELLAAWEPLIPGVAATLAAFGERRPIVDVHAHEHDIRHALAVPEDRRSEIVAESIDWLPDQAPIGRALRIEWSDGGRQDQPGDGDQLVLRDVTPFEVFRSRLGRRTRGQVLDYDWSEDPSELLDTWFIFGPAAVDIGER